MSTNFSFRDLLSPYDFEILVRDLLSLELGVQLKAFAEGSDYGIDLRYSADPDNTLAVQCKRTKSLTKLQLETEAKKIAKLDIKKYYLAVASELSILKCDQILKIFSQWMNDEGQIYSKGRLNELISKYPTVLREHYKLWINSSEVFDQFINNDLLGRSQFLREDIARSLRYYVKHDGYNKAVDILNNYNLIIISGIPGIGKTTMARMLVWAYLQQGFEIIEIRNVNEGERVLKEDDKKKQVLYFDDFLGENFLQFDAVQGRANDLYMFMKRFLAQKGRGKKLIMATREYILNQAKARYAKLDQRELDITKYVLDLAQYSKVNKALILYNHLYYSGITLEHIKNILKDDMYQKIISHRNYSPRIIEAMTINLTNIAPENYLKEFIANLENPLRIWERTFESEISECSQYLLYLLASFGGDILISSFESAFNEFINESISGLHIRTDENSFRNSIREIQDTFIRITLTKYDDYRIEFMNPSIQDFLNSRLVTHSKILEALVTSSLFPDQLFFVYTNFIKDNYHELISNVVDRIVIYWDNFKSSRLIQWYREENSWHINKISLFEKLYLISDNFDLSQELELRDIVVKDFYRLDLSLSSSSTDYLHYVQVLSKVVNFCECDPEKIMKLYIENMYSTHQIPWFERFKEIFPYEYDDFITYKSEEIHRRIDETVDRDVDRENEVGELQNLESEIKEIEMKLGLDLSSNHDKVQGKISSLEDKSITDDELTYKRTDDENTPVSNIKSLFREEMFIK